MFNIVHQRGLSMVELLVALAISSFLVLGITQIYLDGKRSDIFRQNQAANVENSCFAVSILNELIDKAGYRRSPEQSMLEAFPETNTALPAHCDSFAAEAVITKLKSTEGGQTGFCLRYQPIFIDEYMCDGNRSAKKLTDDGPLTLNQTNYVAIKFIPHATDLNQGSLTCITGSRFQLMEGIADMRIHFGLGDSPSFLSAQPMDKKLRANNPFVKADTWSGDGIVRVVRYAILLASRPKQRDSNDSKVLSDWLAGVTDSTHKARLESADQLRMYQQVSGTQTLKNMLP